MNKRTQSATLALLAAAILAVTLQAEPPMAPPAKLPTTPAEVADLIGTADEAKLWHEQRGQRRSQAANDRNLAVHSLRNGPFKKAGGGEDPAYKTLLAKVADLDAQGRAKREAASTAEKAGDLDEKAALEIEGQRLRVQKDATQAEAEAFVIRRCLAIPEAKAAAEQAQVLTQRAKEADEAVLPYWDNVRSHWQNLAAAYQQKAQGVEYKKTRSITLPSPADAERRRAEFARRNVASEIERLAHRLFNALDEKSQGVDKAFALYREKEFAAALSQQTYGTSATRRITTDYGTLGIVSVPQRGRIGQPMSTAKSRRRTVGVGEVGESVNWHWNTG
jgi:hypothetical protein